MDASEHGVERDEVILRWPVVRGIVGMSRSTVWRMIQRGEFPGAIPLSPGAVGWARSEIDAWVKARKAARRPGSRARGGPLARGDRGSSRPRERSVTRW